MNYSYSSKEISANLACQTRKQPLKAGDGRA